MPLTTRKPLRRSAPMRQTAQTRSEGKAQGSFPHENAEYDFAWLQELLRDCESAHRLTDREEEFTSGLRDRVLQYGDKTFLSPKQLDWLRSIETRLHA
jgi:hypothetical protein